MHGMKSFRVYRQRPTIVPSRVVTDYRPEELASFREAFRPVVERRRRGYAMFGVLLGVWFVCMLLGEVLPRRFASWPTVGLYACGLGFLLIVVLLWRSPACPACHNPLEEVTGPYCPACGAKALQPGSWLRSPYCTSCGRKVYYGRGRRLTIRVCTHCGVFLDERGF